MIRVNLQIRLLLLLVFYLPCWLFCFGAEVRIPCKGVSCYDGDTFFVEVSGTVLALPAGFRVDGVEQRAVSIDPFLVKIRLVDNHLKGKTKPLGAPEIRTPSGRAERGAIQARNRLTELVTGKEGEIIINLDLMKTKRNQPNFARLLTLDRVLADFQEYGRRTTAGNTMYREGLVRDWKKGGE
jgi:hypothetical protein